jgi:acetamidase/formamidase
MIDHLAAEQGLSREDAYVLSSLCVGLRISEVVDAWRYVVGCSSTSGVYNTQR